ncbi:efflux RND transporter permease subunit [Echinicola jeungdonensis]|uniref:efflux RND transporter permease subunit n=1 Tax=Echinicola jeungdonensis TaxID=709343 RepID=UPI0025B3E23B|nr:efflux RND transporter permease subunit [Echinicola jeungdonensis]MDN3671388.1 efflux RND transporter permease subunit [Echinicola jeungdonensis]
MGGSTIKVNDVAEVVDSNKEEEILSRLNGNSAIGITIQKQSDANAVDVAERVDEALADLEATYQGSDLKFEVSQDSSDFTLELRKQ